MHTSTSHPANLRLGILAAALCGAFLAAPATAAPPSAAQSWTPWLGCWSPVAAGSGAAEAGVVCVVRNEAAGGVDIRTMVGGEVVASRTLVADGTRREVERGGCAGWEQASWSHDGQVVYLDAELDCENGLRRYASGVIAMAAPDEWLDIQSVLVGGSRDIAVRRLRPADPEVAAAHGVTGEPELAASTARIAAAEPITLDDVIDAAGAVDREVVETLLLERGSRFDLDARGLTRLADAGVPARLIDLMIGVSFPDDFVIDPANRMMDTRNYAASQDYRYGRDPRGFYDPFYDPWGFGYSTRYYGNYNYDPFYYSPFAGPGYGWGFGWSSGYRRGPIIIARPSDDGGFTSSGRMVRGRGFVPSSSSSGNSGTAVGSRSTGSSGGATASSSSGSSKSTGSSTGRTAKKRGGG